MNGFSSGLGLGLGAALMLLSGPAQAADPSPRANAIAAADAAAGLPAAQEPGVPVCATPPESGRKLAGDMELGSEGHSIELQNSGMRDALVKIRHADTGRLAASFFLRQQEALTIEGVPDGRYLIQYAFGPALAADCRSFTRILKANQMPEADELATQVIDDDEHTEVKRSSLSYDISVSESANVKPVAIDAAAFNAE
ncbi:hypothetical protein EIK56_05620 [Sphingomonas sp. C8-2]|jgi:hypothetical protein|uniref:hypothetical protein n=1 Tax=Rhizorhabdus histidinilytica TaxID=439228 RepID=UPI000F773F1A|nr:hypothetical protein EIK56_05620 [Sphingomonas sp. C8-2]